MQQWYAPGYEMGEDRPLFIYPAAGWVQRAQRRAYAAPGYLVMNPADRSPEVTGRAAYYVRMTDGQLVRVWAEIVQQMTLDHRGISLQLADALQPITGRWFDVLRAIDDHGLNTYGFTVSEYPVDMARAEEEGRLAGPELQRLVVDLEAWRHG